VKLRYLILRAKAKKVLSKIIKDEINGDKESYLMRGKRFWHPFDRRLDGSQKSSWA
jgi:hypothetical protein